MAELRLTTANFFNARNRVLTFNEQQRLEVAAYKSGEPFTALHIVLLLETGMRPIEMVRDAYWYRVDWRARVLQLENRRGGDGRLILLSTKAIKALRDLERLSVAYANPRIVPVSSAELARSLRRCSARAGLHNVQLSDLRRTALTRFYLSGLNLPDFMLLSGFRRASQFKPYSAALAGGALRFGSA